MLSKEVEQTRRGSIDKLRLALAANRHRLRGEVNVLHGALGDKVAINDANDDWIDAQAGSETDCFHGVSIG